MKRSDAVPGRGIETGRVWLDRSRWPLGAGVVAGLISLVETALRTDDVGVLPVAMLLGLCATLPAVFVRGHAGAVAATVAAAATATGVLYHGPPIAGSICVVVVWSTLVIDRVRSTRARTAERNASRHAIESTLLEFTARGERARIARELHDVVAHHISMISVQAETARLTTPGMPKEGAERLRAIGDTARTALTEMRRLLGVLREDAGAEPTRKPQPGLQQLLELIDESRDFAGASTRLIVHGRIAVLDPGVELAAYRIVQESLTNARRHAPGAAVDVELDYSDEVLHLRIRDNGPGPTAGTGSAGHGLLGMRERAASVGGELRTGATPAGGFLVEAALPATRLAGTGMVA
ncbi:sensor histidine kinase [Embleya sp. NBC_00896]|uniref:sensor histidine kinase n=1 Tax=Embleya sp. NBC_00896 TaxID=2975961 RepID=UPI00386F3D82|nr:sensor histidine kinase [Embleya sp. NBC_00896]